MARWARPDNEPTVIHFASIMRFLSTGSGLAVKALFFSRGGAEPGSDYNEPASEPRIPSQAHCIPLIDRYFFRDDISIAVSSAFPSKYSDTLRG